MTRRWGKWLLKTAILGLAIFSGLEISLRLFQPSSLDYYRKLKNLHVYHPDYLVGLDPGADYYLRHNNGLWEGRFKINELGYRGSVEPGVGEAVLGCLGDSLVMGFGVSDEDTFCRRLDGITLAGTRFRTQNLGVDAFGSQGYVARLDEAIDEKLPELKTVLLFISPNDFTLPQELRDRGIVSDDETDALREANPEFKQAFRLQFMITRYSFALHAASVARHQLRIRRASMQKNLRRELVESGILEYRPAIDGAIPADHLGFRNYLERSFYRPPPPPLCAVDPGAPGAATDAADAPAISVRHACPTPVPSQVRCEARPPADADLEPLPEITRAAYERMIQKTRQAGVRLIVVFLPVQMETLHCELNGKYSRFFGHALRAEKYFRTRGVQTIDLRKYIPEMCGEELMHADGTPTKYSRVTDYIIQGDGHLTVAGNRWAARGLERELKRLAGADAL
jgi:hypothetical protein